MFKQLILSGYSFNNKKLDSIAIEKNNFQEKFNSLISNNIEEESNLFEKEVEEIEKFVEDTFNETNSGQLKNCKKQFLLEILIMII